MKRFLTFRITAPAALLTSCATVTHRQSEATRIIDGDTMEVAGGIRIRYIGAGAPEMYLREKACGREMSATSRGLVEGGAVGRSLLSKPRMISGIRHRERSGWRI